MANPGPLLAVEELLGQSQLYIDVRDPHYPVKSILQSFVAGNGVFPAHQNMGFAVFRTVYTAESEDLFPLAVKRVRDYFCASLAGGVDDHGEFQYLYDEVLRRVTFPVIEDRDSLNEIPLGQVRSHFEKWLADQGLPTDETSTQWPLHAVCIVIDEPTMLDLVKLPESSNELLGDRIGNYSKLCVKLVEFWGTVNEEDRPNAEEEPYEAGFLKCHPRDLQELWTDIIIQGELERVSGEPGYEYGNDEIPLYHGTVERLAMNAREVQRRAVESETA